MTTPVLSPADSITQVLDSLGIRRAHFAAFANPREWQVLSLVQITSMTLLTPGPLPSQTAAPLDSRLQVVIGDRGQPSAADIAKAHPAATVTKLKDFRLLAWSDVAQERTQELASAIQVHAERVQAQDGSAATRHQVEEVRGEIAGIRYAAQGQGPALVLLPLGFAPSQWEPLLPILRQRFCTIVLRGVLLGVPAMLEERGRVPGYLRVAANVMDIVAVREGESVLEVGSGTGALARWLARRTKGLNPIVGVDISPYFLEEAQALVQSEGLAGQVRFQQGNAEALPFPDASFDVAWSCTVMEEVNADRMLAEMIRVTRPGGRVAVIVRAEDMPNWVNLPVSPELKAKAESRHIPRGESGCDDASLYKRFAGSGLTNLQMFPQIAVMGTTRDTRPFLEPAIVSSLAPGEVALWQAAAAQARAEGTFMVATHLHCAVGTKPA